MDRHYQHEGVVGLLWLAVCLWPLPAEAFRITSPVNDTVLTAGQPVLVRVELGTEIGMLHVRYYWYRQGEEPLSPQLARPALVANASTTPPYGGVLQVPIEAIGRMRLLAVGEVVRGRLAGREEFDEITVQVEPATELLGIEFEVEKPWQLDTAGKILEVPVVGQFADGVTRRIGGVSTGTIYHSSNEQVIEPLAEDLLRVVGNGRAVLTATNRGKSGVLDVVVRAEAEPNRPPTGLAGPDLTVQGGATVILNGLRSGDPDGDPLRYEWSQISGNKVSLLDPNTPKPTFVAPKVSTRRLLRFKLRVTDMKGPDTVKGADSLPSYVNVWIEP